ncbi:hypothetical protein ScPMuIL_016785 [Solemya velum]
MSAPSGFPVSWDVKPPVTARISRGPRCQDQPLGARVEFVIRHADLFSSVGSRLPHTLQNGDHSGNSAAYGYSTGDRDSSRTPGLDHGLVRLFH